MQDQRAAVLDLPVPSWHGDLATARDACADRLAAWDDLLAGVGRRGRGSGADARDAADGALVALLDAGTDPGRTRDLLAAGEARAGHRR